MPKYRPETAKAKAELLIKPYIRNGLNQTALAKKEGVTQSAISQRLSRSVVKDTLQEYINSPKLKNRLISVSEGALKANHYTKRGLKPDYDVRHKYWHDLMTAGGVLKTNGVIVDTSTHLHLNIDDKSLIEEFKRRGLPIPESIKQRLNARTID